MCVANAHAAGIWVGVCGEIASNEEYLAKLIQLGVDEISVVPPNVLRLRARIATLG